MNLFPAFLLGAAAILLPNEAGAATFLFSPGNGDISPAESVVFGFDDPAQDGQVTGYGFTFLTGTSEQGAVPAAGDHSRYLSVLGGGTANISFGAGGVTGFSLDVGSLDSYNMIVLHYVGGGSQSLTGSDLVAKANGDQGAAGTNGRLRFVADQSERIEGVSFLSGQNSFEIDRIAIAAVPEPTIWAMLIGGFGFVGAAARRRGHPNPAVSPASLANV